MQPMPAWSPGCVAPRGKREGRVRQGRRERSRRPRAPREGGGASGHRPPCLSTAAAAPPHLEALDVGPHLRHYAHNLVPRNLRRGGDGWCPGGLEPQAGPAAPAACCRARRGGCAHAPAPDSALACPKHSPWGRWSCPTRRGSGAGRCGRCRCARAAGGGGGEDAGCERRFQRGGFQRRQARRLGAAAAAGASRRAGPLTSA